VGRGSLNRKSNEKLTSRGTTGNHPQASTVHSVSTVYDTARFPSFRSYDVTKAWLYAIGWRLAVVIIALALELFGDGETSYFSFSFWRGVPGPPKGSFSTVCGVFDTGFFLPSYDSVE
jgi:hypothetical protein